MPKLEKANAELSPDDNLEDVSKDAQYVEMNILAPDGENWSADSDPDSTPSPPERDNAYTSDSDSSSSESSSQSSNEDKFKLKLPTDNTKKPTIEELN